MKEQRELYLSRAKHILIAAFIFNSIFSLTDLHFSQGQFPFFLLLRSLFLLQILLTYIFLLLFKKSALRLAPSAMLMLGFSIGLVLTIMCLNTGGFTSLYASGFVFVLLTVPTYYQWHPAFQIALSIIYQLLYLSQGFFVGLEATLANIFSYNWIIFSVGLLTSIMTYLQYSLRIRLREAQAELIRTETLSAVGQLAAGVAHNINTQMSGADMGLSVVLKDLNRDSQTYQTTKTAIESIRNTKALVSTLGLFSKARKEDRAVAHLEEGIESAIKMIRLQPNTDKIVIHKQFDPLHPVPCDIQQLTMAFLNLLQNSVQSGANHIWVSASQKNGSSLLTVRDDGSGITKADQQHIFEPFYTTRDVGEGSGLGLWTVYRTIQEHGGQIRVQSEPGKGTEFIISF